MSKLTINISKGVILPVYFPFVYDYSHRYNVYYGGRASGKTYFLIQKLLIKSLKEKRNILLMNKNTNKVIEGVWKELRLAISVFKLDEYFDFNKTELKATCKLNGSVFKCMGLDDPERIKGYADLSDVLLDEATSFNSDDIDLIDGTLRSTKYKLPLQLYFSFNPVSKANHVYKRFGFDTGEIPQSTFLLKTTYLDNPHVNEGFLIYLENLKKRDYRRWQIEALGDFVSLDKLVFPQITVKKFDYEKLEGKLCVGMDFGFTNDLSTIVCSILNENDKTLHIFDVWGSTNKTNKELAQIIKNKNLAKSVIVADSSEPKSIVELRQAGIVRVKASVKGPDSVLHGIQRLQQYEIIVHPSCEGIIEEFENYCWQKDKSTGEYINKPVDKFNHYIDALRYSLQCVSGAQAHILDKSQLGL